MKLFAKDKRSKVEVLIDDKLEKKAEDAEELKDISEIVDILERRNKLNGNKKVSPDTVAVIAGNLLGIGAIMLFEKYGHVISTKALGFVIRGRV